MKPEDLMIGDWFRVRYTFDGKDFIRTFRISRPIDELGFVCGKGLGQVCLPEELEPIPLTPEILENNGFKKKHPTQHFCEIVIGSFRITVQFGYGDSIDYVRIYETPNDNYIPETNINIYHPKIKYVHELQHVLRLCGIEKEIVL